MRIRDHMDEILEARGYFRKHVAREPDSVFRAVADVLFLTQQHRAEMLKHSYRVMLSHTGRRECEGDRHARVRLLADLLGVVFNVLETSDKDITVTKIRPRNWDADQEEEEVVDESYPLLACEDCLPEATPRELQRPNRRKFSKNRSSSPGGGGCSDGNDGNDLDICSGRGSSIASKTIMLCYSGHQQYDPVYAKSTIDGAAIMQSIIYELVYANLFKMHDALQAAELMLRGDFGDQQKPEIYDKEFVGTAMEALEMFLIPFPYKVAKALDSQSYRNIEYDVWANDRRNAQSAVRRNSSSHGNSNALVNIGSLGYGHACIIRDRYYGEVCGFIMKPSPDKRLMEVYVPYYDSCFLAPRRMILPITDPPAVEQHRFIHYQQYLPSNQDEREESRRRNERDIQDWNVSLANAGDPEWLARHDFSVPPPRFFPVGPPLCFNNNSNELVEFQPFQPGPPAVEMPPQQPMSPYPVDPAVMLSVDQHGNYLFQPTVINNNNFPYPFGGFAAPTGAAGDQSSIDSGLLLWQQQQPLMSFTPSYVSWGVGGGDVMQQNFPQTPMLTPFLQHATAFQYPSPPASPAPPPVSPTFIPSFMSFM